MDTRELLLKKGTPKALWQVGGDIAERMRVPVSRWIEQRARYFKGDTGMRWIFKDPIIKHLAAPLHLVGNCGDFRLDEISKRQAAQIYYGNLAWWLATRQQMSKILDAFQVEGIQIAPLKGIDLLDRLYHDPGLRKMGDVDILVPANIFDKAATILLSQGYYLHKDNGLSGLDTLTGVPMSEWPLELIFVDKNGSILEIHRQLLSTPWFLPAYPFEMHDIWSRAESIQLGNSLPWSVRLSDQDTFAHLCLHQAMHGLQMMHGFFDVDLFVRSLPQDWDWDEFLILVEMWHLRSAVYHTLSFSHYFMETPLPSGLLERLDPGPFARWRVSRLLTAESLLADRPTLGRRYPTLVKIALVDRFSTVARLIIQVGFASSNQRRSFSQSKMSLPQYWQHIWTVIERGD